MTETHIRRYLVYAWLVAFAGIVGSLGGAHWMASGAVLGGLLSVAALLHKFGRLGADESTGGLSTRDNGEHTDGGPTAW